MGEHGFSTAYYTAHPTYIRDTLLLNAPVEDSLLPGGNTNRYEITFGGDQILTRY